MISTALLRWLALLLLSTCNGPMRANAPLALPAPAPPVAAPHVLDPDVVRPQADDPVQRGLSLLRDGSNDQAFAVCSCAARDEAEGDRLAWMRARACSERGDSAGVREALDGVAQSERPLSLWARLVRAQALASSDPAAGAQELTPLAELEWAGQAEAMEQRALAQARANDPEAEANLRLLLDRAAPNSARATIAAPLAELLARRDVEGRIEAIGLWRRIISRAPLSRAARDAATRVDSVLATLPRRQRRTLAELSVPETLAQANAFETAMEHAQAEQAFARAAEHTDDPVLRCQALFGRGRALYNGRERGRAAILLAEVARDCSDPEVRAPARFLAGRGFQSAGELERALEQFGRLEEEVPTHRLADDARMRAAMIDAERGDEASMSARLSTLAQVYPQGDMHGEARFFLAWRARASGRLDEALTQLDASIAEGPGETSEDVRGRTPYWRACVLDELGRHDDARDAWLALARELPLAYYGQQAIVRLSEANPSSAMQARESLGARAPGHLVFAWRDSFDRPEMSRALELLRVGEIDRAQRELDAVLPNDEEMRWLQAALLDRVGEHAKSVTLTRRLRAFMDRPPTGDDFDRWRIAYPRAYEPLIDEIASERSLPPELVRAIAREESSFRADAVSVANAYGLTQLILPTARRFARPLGIDVTTSSLIEPDTNVRVGTAFMAWLWERYRTNPAVLPSAYNAGQGATDRWLRERPQQRLDAWVEEIPYDETRRYTRRVLQSWGIYAWLDRGELAPLPAVLPSAGS